MPSIIQLQLQPLTASAWAPFGTLPSDERTPTDNSDIEFLQHDGHVNFIFHHTHELQAGTLGSLCELLNRHDTHTQTLMPMTAPAYVVVAPAHIDFSDQSDFGEVRAFRLEQHAAATLARGTWHWGPYPIGSDSLRIFNVQGRGWASDNGIVWLKRDHNTVYEVVCNE